jgi:SAM-dependent methyltransferase
MEEHVKYSAVSGTPYEELTLGNICGSTGQPLVLFWVPRREEIQRFVEVAKAVHKGEDKPRVLEVGCGSGLLSYLMAKTEEVDVIGMDPSETLMEFCPYSHPNLKFEDGDSSGAVEKYKNQVDVVVNSWMPNGLNLTPNIRDINARSIIYVLERGGSTGISGYSYLNDPETAKNIPDDADMEDYISYSPGKKYKGFCEWYGPVWNEVAHRLIILKENNPELYKRLFERLDNNNNVWVQLRKDVQLPKLPEINIPEEQKYPWEKDLENLIGGLTKIFFYNNQE